MLTLYVRTIVNTKNCYRDSLSPLSVAIVVHYILVSCRVFSLFCEIIMYYSTGVLIGGCGKQTIHLRPSLIFQPHHTEIFLNIFESVLKVH